MPGFSIAGVGTGPNIVRETSRKHRFLVRILDPLTSDLLFFAKKFEPPTVEIDRVVMHHGQDEIYLPGKNRWLQCGFSFYRIHATNGDRAAAELYDWWSRQVVRTYTSALAQSSNKSPVKKTGEVHILDGAGNSAYTYVLYGAWPHRISPDAFDHSESGISEIKVVLLVDKVKEIRGISVDTATAMCDNGVRQAKAPFRNEAIDNVPPEDAPPPVKNELNQGGVGGRGLLGLG